MIQNNALLDSGWRTVYIVSGWRTVYIVSGWRTVYIVYMYIYDCINSLWDLGVKDDMLHLIHLLNIKASPMGDAHPSLLVARGLPRDTKNILVYWKKNLPVASFTVSILGQHFWSALGSAFATSSSRHQGGYNLSA